MVSKSFKIPFKFILILFLLTILNPANSLETKTYKDDEAFLKEYIKVDSPEENMNEEEIYKKLNEELKQYEDNSIRLLESPEIQLRDNTKMTILPEHSHVKGIFGDPYCIKLEGKQLEIFEKFIKDNKIEDSRSNRDKINYLKFVIGKCKPLIVVSGLYATKLVVEFKNCELVKQKHANIYDACFTKPATKCVEGEKKLWLSSNFMNSYDTHSCFANLASLNIVRNEGEFKNPDKAVFYEAEYHGFRITYHGDTDETRSDSRCGLGASENLLDLFSYFGKKSPVGFHTLNEKLIKEYGYTPGLNLFGLPHDWRDILDSKVTEKMFMETLNLAYKLNQKKVDILAHSLGSLVTYEQIMKMTQAEKDEKINSYNVAAPPFLGSIKALKAMILGTKDFNNHIKIVCDLVNLFLSIESQRIMNSKIPQGYQIIPNNFFGLHKDADWMKAALGRVQVENEVTSCVQKGKTKLLMRGRVLREVNPDNEKSTKNNINSIGDEMKTDYYGVFSSDDKKLEEECLTKIAEKPKNKQKLEKFTEFYPFFPLITSDCFYKNLVDVDCKESSCVKTFWDEKCRLHMNLPYTEPYLAKIEYTDKDTGNKVVDTVDFMTTTKTIDFIKKYQINQNDKDFTDYVYTRISSTLEKMEHPGVDTSLYFINSFKTDFKYNINFNPLDYTKKNEYVDDHYTANDYIEYTGGDTTVPTFSALAPFLKWSRNGKYWTSFVHVCTKSSSHVSFMENNFYESLECGCSHSTDEACSHSSMITDQRFIKHFVENKVEDAIDRKKNISEVERLEKVKDYMHNLPQLTCSNLHSWPDYLK